MSAAGWICIADDLTGAADLASRFSAQGLRVHFAVNSIRAHELLLADVVVVALRSRMTRPAEAVRDTLTVLDDALPAGYGRVFLKFASTFDSTDSGNIGQVVRAVMSRLRIGTTLMCPAWPAAGRTTYQGIHLIDGRPLARSEMRHHPLTPMTRSDLVDILRRHTDYPIALIPHSVVAAGGSAIRGRIEALEQRGGAIAVVDALTETDLHEIAAAAADLALVAGASGIARLLPFPLPQQSVQPSRSIEHSSPGEGFRVILSGSCSSRTRHQIRVISAWVSSFQLDPVEILAGVDVVGNTLDSVQRLLQAGHRSVVINTSACTKSLGRARAEVRLLRAAAALEKAMAEVAMGLQRMGSAEIIVAGGETASAVADALGIRTLQVGPRIQDGLSWFFDVNPESGQRRAFAFKPGNFGSEDFFRRAFCALDNTLH